MGGLCVWLGLREPRALVVVLGPDAVGDIEIDRAARRAGDIKRPQRSRRWTLAVRDPGGAVIGRRLRFRSEAQAREMAEAIRRFSGR